MEAYFRFVKRLADALAAEGLDYAFTGAVAVSVYGAPRTTSDVDVVVAVADARSVKAKVTSALERAGLNVDERQIDAALTSGYRIATVRDRASPFSVDVIFADAVQKRAGVIDGVRTFFQAPEDLVLAKLRMIKATVPRERAVKDEEDVKAILAFTKVDLAAVRKQARKQGTLEILESLME